MKKIIDGKKYDTETAREVGYWSNNRSYSDFSYCSETLYQKRTGEFFLFGDGGAMSRYAESCGQNEWTGGSHIEPLTYKAAQKWAEEHLDADEYEAIFGEVPEDNSTTVISIRLPADAAETARRAAAKEGIGIGEYITRLIKTAKDE